MSPLEELCSWDGLQMGHEKALGKLQKEITLQNEKWMHIYQPGVAEERAPSIWGHRGAPPQGVRAAMNAIVFLDSNLPKLMPFPRFSVTQITQALLCFTLFICFVLQF